MIQHQRPPLLEGIRKLPSKQLHSPRSSGCRDSRSQTNSKTIRAILFLIRGRFLSATFLLSGAALLLCGSPANASLTISPSTIDNAYVGPINLTITGLDSNGQSGVIEEYFDSDGSGTINAGDLLL